MHVVKIISLVFLGIWLYAFIGARLGHVWIQEARGLQGDNWASRLLILLLWPIFGIVEYFEE